METTPESVKPVLVDTLVISSGSAQLSTPSASLTARVPGSEPAPAEEVELALEQETVRSVVRELPEKQRTVIQLRFGLNGDRDPVSIREAARQLEMPPSELRRVEQRALEELALRRELAALRAAA